MIFLRIFLIFWVLIFSVNSWAVVGDWFSESDHDVRVRLLASGIDSDVGGGDVVLGAVEFDLGDDWKIYWRHAGESGLPPEFDFSGSENVSFVDLSWTAPRRLDFLGITSFGYSEHVAFPFRVGVEDFSAPVDLRLRSNFLACSDVCIPLEADLDLRFGAGDVGGVVDSVVVNLRDEYVRQVPTFEIGDDLLFTDVRHVRSDSEHHYYRVAVLSSGVGDDVGAVGNDVRADVRGEIFVEDMGFGIGAGSISVPRLSYLSGGGGVLAEFTSLSDVGVADSLRITYAERDGSGNLVRSIETESVVSEDSLRIDSGFEVDYNLRDLATDPYGIELPSFFAGFDIWILLIGFAFIGGLILNIMPCVLPALGVKIFSLSQKDGDDRRAIRASFLATALGIICCFLLLAIILVILKFLGVQIGWGIQYQQPAFLSILFMVMVIFSGNLFGLFEVNLPSSLSVRLSSLTGGGSNLSKDFLLGVLATILATPCTAPFLSTAVGVALIVGGAETVILFLCLGLGMATPYIAIALYPRVASFVPRGGRWMIWLRIFLGILLAMTSVWLFFLLSSTHSMRVALMVAGLSLTGLLYLYIRGRGILNFRSPVFLIPGLLFVGGFLLTFSPVRDIGSEGYILDDGYWEDFSEERISESLLAGKLVFVDVTADWCVSCKFNKFSVLRHGSVEERLSSPDVVALRADWTLPDVVISRYLRSHGRAGVPFNIIYGVGAPDGIILGEILTVSEVLSALSSASG